MLIVLLFFFAQYTASSQTYSKVGLAAGSETYIATLKEGMLKPFVSMTGNEPGARLVLRAVAASQKILS
jgi:hypothetical protein